MGRHKGGESEKVYKLIFLSILSILLIVQSKVAYSESPTSDFSVEAILEGHQKIKALLIGGCK